MFTRLLSEEIHSRDFGGKAESLSHLMAFGVNVPSGFAISKAGRKDFKLTQNFPVLLVNEITSRTTMLSSSHVIVRSSAIGEDSKEYSFAGQLDSFVVENELNAILEGVRKCWDGLENDRLKMYSKQTGVALKEMGVIVQEFVEPNYAGVTFTQSPQKPEEIYTEYVNGRGELLVSGQVTPSIFVYKIGNEKTSELPFNGRLLIDQCLKLKDYYGYELDIEWVAKGSAIYFVQARPITVTLKEDVHWSNTNLNENYPDPISPLLYSIARDSYYHYFKNLAALLELNKDAIRQLEYDFSNTVGIWGNRIYYNMTSIHNIMSASPLKSYFIDAFNKFVGYNNSDVATSDRSKTSSLVNLSWRLIKLNFRLERNVKEIESMVGSFSEKVQNSAPTKDLFYEFLDLRFNQWYRASLADFFAMIHYKLLGVFTRRFYGDDSVGIQNKLVQAIPDLLSTEPLNMVYDLCLEIQNNKELTKLFEERTSSEVWELISSHSSFSSFKISIERYLQKWGFRCSGELMFLKQSYVEEPERFITLIQSYLKQEAQDPRLVISVKAEERKRTVNEFSKRIIRKRHVFFPIWMLEILIMRLMVKLCMQAISSRERVRYKQAEMYFRFKEVVKRIGQQANLGNAIFYMSYKEIGEMIAASSMNTQVCLDETLLRKESFDLESSKIFPEHFVTKFGERPDHIVEEINQENSNGVYTGLAASGGRIKARVMILESVLESEKLRKGDILVTRQTDPGWAMVFPIIGGLIVERGGALSHGAIVAREFGIPAVVGAAGITDILKDEDVVVLDGNLGKIQIVES